MYHQGVSEIFFEQFYIVPASQTARELYATLPHSRHFSELLSEGFATAYLVAVMEAVCMQALQEHIDINSETVVGTSIKIEHCAPTPAGARLKLRGWVEQICTRHATFHVSANDEHGVISEGTLKFAVVRQKNMADRLEHKTNTARLELIQSSATYARPCDVIDDVSDELPLSLAKAS